MQNMCESGLDIDQSDPRVLAAVGSLARWLGRVDGFEQDEGCGESDDRPEVSCGFLAA